MDFIFIKAPHRVPPLEGPTCVEEAGEINDDAERKIIHY